MSDAALEARGRRAARRDGLYLVKLRESSLDFAQLGPYMLVNAHTGNVEASGMTLAQVAMTSAN